MSSEKEHPDLLLSNQLCFRLYTASRLIVKSYTPLLTRLGLTYPQYLVMMVLWEQDCQPVNDIAKRLMLQTNTVTPLLQRMEAMKLVTKHKSDTDQRQLIVELTERGKAMEESACQIPGTQVKRMVCSGGTEEMIPGLNEGLDDLIKVLAQMTGEG